VVTPLEPPLPALPPTLIVPLVVTPLEPPLPALPPTFMVFVVVPPREPPVPPVGKDCGALPIDESNVLVECDEVLSPLAPEHATPPITITLQRGLE
jgi:hypothetical protein